MASYKKDVPFIPDEMKSPEPSEVARRLGQVIYDGLLYTSAENIALCLEDYAQSQNAALRAEVEALRARVALLEGWNVGTEPPPPFVGSGSDDCEILIHASGFYRHPTESYEYNEWVRHGGDIVDVAFWRYTKKAQERLS